MNPICIMRGVEVLGVFVIIKAVYEMYKHHGYLKKSKGVYNSTLHTRQHIAALLGIITYNIYDIWSYVYFEIDTMTNTDYSVLFFNLLFMNILWLIIITHFKQERLDRTMKVSFWDLFKF